MVRGAGYTWNDILDRDFDRQVSRTKSRPRERGAVSPLNAFVFTVVQIFTRIGTLLTLLPRTFLYNSVPSIILTTLYPLAKRITNYPQVVLGSVFSWGVIMAFPALNIDPFSSSQYLTATGCLYVSFIARSMLYDTFYSQQDIQDDLQIGVKSAAVRHQDRLKVFLSTVALVQASSLFATGLFIEASLIYFAGTCGIATLTIVIMIRKVDLKSIARCLWWFKYGSLLTGGSIASGFFGEYIARLNQETVKLF